MSVTSDLVLHINTGYATRKVHSGLVKGLDNLNINQFVYAPVRKRNEIGGNKDSSLRHTDFAYSYILRPWHKVLFRLKAYQIYTDLKSKLDLKSVGLSHAHTLYSDGSVSLLLKQKFSIPFVVSVRNVDINSYMKWRPDLVWKRNEILKQATKVNFLSPAYREKLLNKLPGYLSENVEEKSIIMPNGLDNFWFQEFPNGKEKKNEKLNVLYVGEFTDNKNVVSLLKAAKLISEERKIQVTLVGKGGNGEKKIDDMLKTPEYSFVKKTGKINSREILRDVYRKNDIFVMVSKRETFGVTYIEALSQGIPVIHSKGQGIDGYFEDETVSFAVNPDDPVEISKNILKLSEYSQELVKQCKYKARDFSWDEISRKCSEMYKKVLNNQ